MLDENLRLLDACFKKANSSHVPYVYPDFFSDTINLYNKLADILRGVYTRPWYEEYEEYEEQIDEKKRLMLLKKVEVKEDTAQEEQRGPDENDGNSVMNLIGDITDIGRDASELA